MKILLALSIAFLAACTLGPSKDERDPASVLQAGDYRLRDLTNERVLQYSSSKKLKIGDLKILTDNTDAFLSKIDIIRKAKSDLVMMYYIFGTDESSSYLSKELILAAQRGVKIKILVDFFVNYKNYDHLRMLEEKGNGNIQVAFYGVPAGPLLESMSYLVSPCEEQNKACVEKKWSLIKSQYAQGKVPFFTRLLVTGLYGKLGDLSKIALSAGSQIDLSAGSKISDEERKQLFDFIDLVFRAKVKGEAGAKIKLAMALAFYGKDTLPIYERLLAVFPLAGGDRNLSAYWENATDFIHHKLILADSRYLQLGGRNVEDSYHMPASPSGKYTFLDTDVYTEIQDGGADIRQTFNKMWNFSDSVRTLRNLDPIVMNEFGAKENLPSLVNAIKKCDSVKKTPEYDSCIEKTATSQLAMNMSVRMLRASENLEKGRAAYEAKHLMAGNTALVMNDPDPFVTYIENLSFTKASPKRVLGANGDKNISELWIQSIKNTCKTASSSNPKQITLLNAYVFMPSALYMTIGDVLSGRIRCPNTTITIATNSMESTDLGIINIFANYQMLLLTKEVNPRSSTTLNILEMKRPATQTTYSLHTKASIFGDDLIIGSANADIRSYHMDSNNALFIRGAPELTSNYKRWVANFIDPTKGRFVNKTAYYRGLTFKQAQSNNAQVFEMMIQKYGQKLAPDSKQKARKLFSDICIDIFEESRFFLSPQFKDMSDRQKQSILVPRLEAFDSKYQTL